MHRQNVPLKKRIPLKSGMQKLLTDPLSDASDLKTKDMNKL